MIFIIAALFSQGLFPSDISKLDSWLARSALRFIQPLLAVALSSNNFDGMQET